MRTTSIHPNKLLGSALSAVVALLLASTVLVIGTSAPASAVEPPAGLHEVTGGDLDWGVKASFRSYVTGGIAQGSITTEDGATTNPDGTFHFMVDGDETDGDDIEVSSIGGVYFEGHGGLLQLDISNIRLSISGAVGTLVADVVSLPLEAEEPVVYDDVVFGDLDLSTVEPTADGGVWTWTSVPVALTEAGVPAFADFYEAGDALDPVSFSLELEEVELPEVVVSATTGIDPMGQTVTVTGSGFDPSGNLGARPPLSGQPAGVYVVFAKIGDPWRPSQGAPSSTRTVVAQRWALPAASKAIVDPSGTNPGVVLLEEDGTFDTTLTLEALDGGPNTTYAVITYPGSGAVNAIDETATPIYFAQEFPDVSQTHPFFAAISWLSAEGITTGFDDGFFKPSNPVTRQAMAAFVYRLAGEPEFPLPDEPTFSDVPESNPFYVAIEWLAYEGISEGYDDGTYRPLQDIARQAMAAFLYRAAGEPEFTLPEVPTFSDVGTDHPFYLEIEWMAATEISEGYDDGTFRPLVNTARQATAAFLQRYDALPAPS